MYLSSRLCLFFFLMITPPTKFSLFPYPTLFRSHEVWDLVVINSDGTNFHVLKSGVQNEVTRFSPIWAPDGQSVFCQDRIGRTHVKTRHTQKSHMPSSAKKKKE